MTAYVPDHRDVVKEITGVPQMSTGAPMPLLVQSEYRCSVAYICGNFEPSSDGTTVRVASAGDDEPIVIVEFGSVRASYFGPPNDEAMGGHPLAARGLQYYAAHEVFDSSWIRALEKMNRVHHRHTASLFAGLRHFIWTFHDSTFECVANGYTVRMLEGSVAKALMLLLDEGNG